MNIIGIVALFGAGYMYNDYRKTHSTFTPTHCLDSYGPPSSIKQYLKNVAMDKMDVIFYGKNKHKKATRKENFIKYNHYYGNEHVKSITCPIVPFNSCEYAEDVLEEMKRDIQMYGVVRVRDFLQHSDMPYGCNEVSYDNVNEYGWYTLDDVEIYQDEDDGYYYIDLPDPIYIY